MAVYEAGGGILLIPCLWSSAITLSIDGGLRPRGRAIQGLFKASLKDSSITYFGYTEIIPSISEISILPFHFFLEHNRLNH